MIQQLEGFDAYATGNLPASALWDVASNVTIVPDAGRSGFSGDNAAFFDASLSPLLTKAISPEIESGIYVGTFGFAIRPIVISGEVTLAGIDTAITRFNLMLSEQGALKITQVTGGVLLGTICETADDVVPIGTGGCYIEARLIQQAGLVSAVQIRVSDQFGDMNPLAQGAILAQIGTDVPYTTLRFGGALTPEVGQWYLDDVYLTDGVRAATPVVYDGTIVWNDSYLGNTHVHTVYATADGYRLSVGNTPWTPNIGSTSYNLINEHPPDEDATYISADTAEQLSTFVFNSNRAEPFGLKGCCAYAPLFGLAWVGRLRVDADPASVSPIIRTLVTGTLATDDVVAGDAIAVSDTDYAYYRQFFDRNPSTDQPWTMAVFSALGAGVLGSVEFGIRFDA